MNHNGTIKLETDRLILRRFTTKELTSEGQVQGLPLCRSNS